MGLPKHYGTNWTYYNNDTINNNCHRLVQDGIPSPGTPCIHAFYTTHNQCKLIESTTPPSRNISWLSSSFPSNEIDLKKNVFTKRWGTFMNFRDALQQNDGNYLGAFQELGTRKIPTNCLIPAGNHQSSRSKNFETPVWSMENASIFHKSHRNGPWGVPQARNWGTASRQVTVPEDKANPSTRRSGASSWKAKKCCKWFFWQKNIPTGK